MPHVQPRRRRVLRSTAGLVALGLAGCLGAPASTAGQGESTATVTPESDATDHHEDSGHGTDGHHDHSPTEHESGHGHDHDAPVASPTDAATVDMTTTDSGDHFEPHVTRVNVGGTVTWVNESGTHSATAYHPANDRPLLMPEAAEPFDSGVLTEAGGEYERTFDTAGVYHYFCLPHESAGMLGSVIVGEPDPHDQPALEAVPESLPAGARQKIEHLNEKCNEALGHTH